MPAGHHRGTARLREPTEQHRHATADVYRRRYLRQREHILLSMPKAGEKEGALVKSKEAARLRAEQSGMSVDIELSERERRIVERLNQNK